MDGLYLAAVYDAVQGLVVGGVNASSATSDHTYTQYAVNASTRHRDATNVVSVVTNFRPSTRPWFKATVAANGSAFTEYKSVGVGGATAYAVSFATPAWDGDGNVVAVTGGDIRVARIQEEVAAIGTVAGDAAARAVLVSHTGAVLACSNAAVTLGCVTPPPAVLHCAVRVLVVLVRVCEGEAPTCGEASQCSETLARGLGERCRLTVLWRPLKFAT